jgi:hypothetical protein
VTVSAHAIRVLVILAGAGVADFWLTPDELAAHHRNQVHWRSRLNVSRLIGDLFSALPPRRGPLTLGCSTATFAARERDPGGA